MTAVFATATVATAALGLEIVQYEPISKIGGSLGVFNLSPTPVTTISSGTELTDDDDVTLTDDSDVTMTDDGA